MDTFWGLTTTAWTAIYTLLTAGLLLAALLAARYAKHQWQAVRDQASEARQAQLEAMRPYVVVTAPPAAVGSGLFDLAITNIGARPAQNINVTLDPPPRRANEDPEWAIAAAKMLTEPISMLAPGQELATYYDNRVERRGRDDLPTSHRIRVVYEDLSGNRFEEETTLDLNAGMGSLSTDIYTVHHVGKELKKIREQFDRASILSRTPGVEVAAVVEDYYEHQERVAQENIRSLENIQKIRPNDHAIIGRLEQAIAKYEATKRREGRGGSRRHPRLRSSAARRC